MKFKPSRRDGLPRIGCISQIDNYPDVNFTTPNCLLYTKFGAVPFLTNDIVKQIYGLPNLTFASLNFLRERFKVFRKFGKGLAQYSGLGIPVILFQNDPTEAAVTRAVDKTSIQVWAVGGRLPVTMEQYADCVVNALPVAFQMPVDNETSFPDSTAPTKKRCQKSVQRTRSYASMLEEIVASNEKLQKIPPLISVAGGNDLDQRLRGITSVDFSRASGIVLDGFFHESLEGDRSSHLETVFSILSSVCSRFPPHLPRFLTNLWQPDEVVRACLCGVDLFDGSLPFRLTRSGIAWLYTAYRKDMVSSAWICFPLQAEDLKAEVYRQPMQPDCPCFACQRHNQGYVSHLHSVKEMLAHILLMIHNSTQCYAFFADLRQAIADGRVDEFAEMSKAHHFPEDLLHIDLTIKTIQNGDFCLVNDGGPTLSLTTQYLADTHCLPGVDLHTGCMDPYSYHLGCHSPDVVMGL
ncbi:Queuine tRNA-ribosyltransferase subunit qtrtd1 [Echinococcus granulosus]|uniref:Queuine tRNA-ribosyltransferase accessory subunit 2 n=1 Tax=Echinococcus granulosus TaxID=6210 RepID=W6ULC1_ECHGR|nr:Queuine tRNA-ribosyltransferase subunit qtrtd1 [Echinococcus granulosus]EUB61873.1 Queuine tRNA-ribosyltransferase subunit qtrtd1 [Echinococcus granulosus]